MKRNAGILVAYLSAWLLPIGSASAYEQFPSPFTLYRDSWAGVYATTPPGNVNSHMYAVNQTSTLSGNGALGQTISFTVTWNGGYPASNIFSGSVVSDHYVVGLNHRVLYSGGTPTGNVFIGVVFGATTQCGSKSPGIAIEWARQMGSSGSNEVNIPIASCKKLPSGITTFDVTFTAYGDGHASAVAVSGQSTVSVSGYESGWGSNYAGAGIAGISQAVGYPYSVQFSNISLSLIYPSYGGGQQARLFALGSFVWHAAHQDVGDIGLHELG